MQSSQELFLYLALIAKALKRKAILQHKTNETVSHVFSVKPSP